MRADIGDQMQHDRRQREFLSAPGWCNVRSRARLVANGSATAGAKWVREVVTCGWPRGGMVQVPSLAAWCPSLAPAAPQGPPGGPMQCSSALPAEGAAGGISATENGPPGSSRAGPPATCGGSRCCRAYARRLSGHTLDSQSVSHYRTPWSLWACKRNANGLLDAFVDGLRAVWAHRVALEPPLPPPA